LPQTHTDERRRAQDLEESRNSRNQVNLVSRIHGSLLSLLPCQQAASLVGILSEDTILVRRPHPSASPPDPRFALISNLYVPEQ